MSHIVISCEQGTPEWHQARCGVTTASMFSTAIETVDLLTDQQKRYVEAIQRGMDKSEAKEAAGYSSAPRSKSIDLALAGHPLTSPAAGSVAYADELAIEILSGQPYGDTFQTFAMKRGSEEEQWARARYEQLYDVEVVESGIALTEDRRYGYSTDGRNGRKGNIEVKTPLSTAKIRNVLETDDTSEYEHQIQGGMWITGAEFCDLIMWVPSLSSIDNDIYVKRIHRNDDFIDDMVAKLLEFNQRVDAATAFWRKQFRRDGLAAAVFPAGAQDLVSREAPWEETESGVIVPAKPAAPRVMRSKVAGLLSA